MILCGRFESLLTLAELSPVYKTHPLGASKSAVGVHSVLCCPHHSLRTFHHPKKKPHAHEQSLPIPSLGNP